MTGKIAVYIGTTNGPVRIERISREPVPLSEVFVGRGIEPVGGISDEYDNFVRPGRPVDKAFGPFDGTSFRMDLSQEIKTGQSWQLAAFVAHGLEAKGCLAGVDETPDHIIVLTGTVDADFNVGAVGHIQEKLQALKPLIEKSKTQGLDVQIFVPSGEAVAVDPAIPVTEVFNALSALGQDVSTSPKGKPYRPIAIGLFVVIASGGYGLYLNVPNDQPAVAALTTVVPKKPVTQWGIQVYERRAPSGKTCAQVQFSGVETDLIPVAKENGATYAPSRLAELCGLQFELSTPEGNASGKARLQVESGKFVNQSAAVTEKQFKGKLTWAIDLPRFLQHSFQYQLFVKTGEVNYAISHSVEP